MPLIASIHAVELDGICLRVPGIPQWAVSLDRHVDHLYGLLTVVFPALCGVHSPSVLVVVIVFFAASFFGDFLIFTGGPVLPFLCPTATNVFLVTIFANFNYASFHRVVGHVRI